MRERAFLNRLQKELPDWAVRGWVTPKNQAAILAHVEAQAATQTRMVPIALAVLGVLTFGAGVITFFAANWDAMAKVLKLAVLFGGMWLAYGLGGYGLAAKTGGARVLGQALTLLGVVLFGANIMLIAQIYHIDSHYPNGVLLWAVGALAVTYAAGLQTPAVAGLVLAILWSGMEVVEFGRFAHWPFLLLWALFLPAILRGAWRYGAGAAMATLIAWCAMTLIHWSFERHGEEIFLMQLYLLAAMLFYILGTAMEDAPKLQPLAGIVRRFALIALLLAGHAFVYEDLFNLGWAYGTAALLDRPVEGQWLWAACLIPGVAVTLGLGLWQLRREGAGRLDTLAKTGLALLVWLGLAILASLFVPASEGAATGLYIAFNLLIFLALIWLIVSGYRRGDQFQVNTAFLFFAVNMLALYFDYFFSLMSRSLFFMAGGALLFAGGFFLERQRRRLIGGMAPQELGEEP